jgi:general secretion pathway protein F/type IV pilus assembly protein PilC
MVALTRFCRILGTLLQAGVPILQSLQIGRDAAGLAPLAEAIDDAGENVKAGQPLHEPLGASRMFPPDVLEMIAVAEESNQMENTLLRIADTVERRTNRKVDLAVRLLEPLLLVCIATVVGFVALGLFLPIFEMASQMQ